MLHGGAPIPDYTKQSLLQDGVVKPQHIPELADVSPEERDRIVARIAHGAYTENVMLDLMGATLDTARPDPDLQAAANKK
jgi:hypothetical protein